MIPVGTIRQAIFTALSGNVTDPVVSIPQAGATDYVLIDSIRVFEGTAQTNFAYDCNITLEVVKKYSKTGNKTESAAIALLIDNIFRPSVTGFITVPGWSTAGIWLDSSEEFVDVIEGNKVVRLSLTYFMKLFKN